jgi:hypothetical protein
LAFSVPVVRLALQSVLADPLRRAITVRDYLTSLGVPIGNIVVQGYGRIVHVERRLMSS